MQKLVKAVAGKTIHPPEREVKIEGCYDFGSRVLIKPCTIDDFGSGLKRDLIIVKTVDPITFPTQLVSLSSIESPRYAHVVGFGSTAEDGGGRNGIKLTGEVPIVSLNCSGSSKGSLDKELYKCRPMIEMVAGRAKKDGAAGTDTCKGDSGGPIMIGRNERLRNVWPYDFFVIGITSRAIYADINTADGPQRLCGDGGIYSVIDDAVIEWAGSITKQNNQEHFAARGID